LILVLFGRLPSETGAEGRKQETRKDFQSISKPLKAERERKDEMIIGEERKEQETLEGQDDITKESEYRKERAIKPHG